MLYIIRQDGQEYTWHVGDLKPSDNTSFTDVKEIQADGDELEYIQRNFSNIPMHTGRVVSWKGSVAQFIYDGLNGI